MINLPIQLAKELSQKPETGMGYQIVSIILKDGRKFDQVVIVEGRITEIKNQTDIPFTKEQIVNVILTHDKWDFVKEDNQ